MVFTHNADNLLLLARPELVNTLTKLHAFDIDNVDQLVFMDADTLVVSDLSDELFGYLDDADFAAAPDIGWPDCFNSGVFALKPSHTLFLSLLEFANTTPSFDGNPTI